MKSLVLKAQSGSTKAKEQLVSLLSPRVQSCSRYYGRRCGVDAADLEQEMWLGVFRALERVDVSIGDPIQFLLSQGRFALLTSLRGRPQQGVSVEAAESVPDDGSIERLVVEGQSAESFISSLDGTASKIVSYLLDGHSRSDAARFLGCTPANVTYHLRRVEADLTAALKPGA